MIARLRLAILFILAPMTVEAGELSPRLTEYIAARTAEFERIPVDRRERLTEITAFGRSQIDCDRPVRLTFICTHNSRRSQMAQVWATVAAAYYGVPEVEAFAGGTERTAFNPRAVAALERAGVEIKQRDAVLNAENPQYEVRLGLSRPLVCFSKVYNESPNPDADFAAVMTCSEADKNCPHVAGAKVRIALPFDDPKLADGTSEEAKVYDKRCEQIAREMLFAFSRISNKP